MKLMKILWLLLVVVLTAVACSDSDDKGKAMIEHDPNREVTITRFFPDSGGIAEKMIFEGTNFGSDTSKIKLYFNDKRATIITAAGDKMYALAPRLPGEICQIKLTVGEKTVEPEKTFKYLARMNVSTIAGSRGTSTTTWTTGGPLATVTFGPLRGIAVDGYGNAFVSMYSVVPNGVARVDMRNNDASWTADILAGATAWNTATVNKENNVVYFAGNSSGVILELDPLNLWMPRVRMLKEPKENQIEKEGMFPFVVTSGNNTLHSIAWHPVNGLLYSRGYQGRMLFIDPEKDYIGICFPRTEGEKNDFNDPIRNNDSFLAISPLEPDWIYVGYSQASKIRRYNINTYVWEEVAGPLGNNVSNTKGWRDGTANDVLFNQVKGMAFDKDGILYAADFGNHCIRRIDTKTKMVTTVAGIPGSAGHVDGAPQVAKMDSPWDVSIDDDGNIFVAENGLNRLVRRITLE